MATIWSQRTKDENTARASSRLFELADTPKKILKLAHVRLEQAIKPAGFYRNKTKTIIKVCGLLLGKYNGNVPDSMNELIKLPGVGEKTAACVIVYGFGKPEIPVDVHVGRVSKRLGWTKSIDPKKVRQDLMKVVPGQYWLIINDLFVKHGQRVCRAKPKCNICFVTAYCQYYQKVYTLKPKNAVGILGHQTNFIGFNAPKSIGFLAPQIGLANFGVSRANHKLLVVR